MVIKIQVASGRSSLYGRLRQWLWQHARAGGSEAPEARLGRDARARAEAWPEGVPGRWDPAGKGEPAGGPIPSARRGEAALEVGIRRRPPARALWPVRGQVLHGPPGSWRGESARRNVRGAEGGSRGRRIAGCRGSDGGPGRTGPGGITDHCRVAERARHGDCSKGRRLL